MLTTRSTAIPKRVSMHSAKGIACAFLYILLFTAGFSIAAGARAIEYSQLPNSSKLKIRLTSHLLIDASSSNDNRQLFLNNIPIAADCRNKKPEEVSQLIQELSKYYNEIIVIGYPTQRAKFDHLPIRTIWIDERSYETYNLTAEQSKRAFPASLKELLLVELRTPSLQAQDLLPLWANSGKLPNFIHPAAESLNQHQAIEMVKSLNSHEIIFGMVSSNERLLTHVLLEDTVYREINGYFCIPKETGRVLKPYKAGYHFSPDVILNTFDNYKNMKVFKGTKHEISYGLTDFFHFDKKIGNQCRKNSNSCICNDVEFVEDPERGGVAYFRNGYIDAGIDSKNILTSDFSITLWIKPTALSRNNGILSKGVNFAIKLYNGKLTYTMPDIKDYISEKRSIPINRWSHIGIVHSAIENKITLYLNGQLYNSISLPVKYTPSEKSLLIGNNLWQEPFKGYMSDIKIWERELNDDEIRTDYLSPTEISNQSYAWMLVAAAACLLLATLFVLQKKRTKKNSVIVPVPKDIAEPQPKSPHSLKEKSGIYCFGNLHIVDLNRKDIAAKLSPKLKQLFTLILLHSTGDKKGITSQQMNDLLWTGMSAANAKNVRGTNMQHLRQLLSSFSEISISFNEKSWFLNISESVFCDYVEADRLKSTIEAQEVAIPRKQLTEWVNIMRRGRLLTNVDATWLDSYKDEFGNKTIEFCLKMLHSLDEKNDAALILDISTIISTYDELSEDALKKKVKILTLQGKHSLAKASFDSYKKLYNELYQSEYPVDFLQMRE